MGKTRSRAERASFDSKGFTPLTLTLSRREARILVCQQARISVSRLKASSGSESREKKCVSSASGPWRQSAAGLMGSVSGYNHRVSGQREQTDQSVNGHFKPGLLPGFPLRRRFHYLAAVNETTG